jgi:hypothetical protein
VLVKELFICEQMLSGSLSFVQGTKLVKYIGEKSVIKETIKCVPA